MPGSAPDFKPEIKAYILKHYPNLDAAILDIGAGSGTYADLLKDVCDSINAIEVHSPYIDEFKLTEKYLIVFNNDCRYFPYLHYFHDVIIAGDIIEHLTIADARATIDKMLLGCDLLIVSVPYLCQQGAVAGVEWEIHQQSDLTPDIMLNRYPQLKLLIENDRIGVYVNK